VQDVAHEHDAEREQCAQSNGDCDRGRHDRAHKRDPERVAEAEILVLLASGVRAAGRAGGRSARQLRQPRDQERRHDERRGVEPEHQQERTAEQIVTR
jgi:hypothetical protein